MSEAELERFAAFLRASDASKAAQADAERAQRDAARTADRDRRDHAAQLAEARRNHERSIDAVRRAKASGSGRADADAAWKATKARLVELETGARPAWAPAEPTRADDGGDDTPKGGDDTPKGGDDTPAGDDAGSHHE